jgi:predicted transposase/invertase (TIGR01784 family)
MPDDSEREIPQIFDLLFKRLLQEASAPAVVALINGLFGTDFPPDSPVSFLNRESVTEDLRKIVSDLMILMAGEIFHCEAQIDDDLNMALRMFRYGYHEAVIRAETGADGNLTITFPRARILYWETTQKTPDTVTLHIVFPDRSLHDFTVPAFKVLEHEIGELERMRLALLLPFYMLKYRKQVQEARSGEERLALVPAVEGTMGKLLDAVKNLREAGLLTEGDGDLIIGEAEFLYSRIYERYEGFREARTMVDERIMTRFDRVRMEGIAEGMEKGRAEIVQNLLKAGVSKDIIIQATGLSMADIGN